MNISHLDHLVSTVESISRSCDFYHDIMGMRIIDFGDGREGSADLCFISPTPIEEI